MNITLAHFFTPLHIWAVYIRAYLRILRERNFTARIASYTYDSLVTVGPFPLHRIYLAIEVETKNGVVVVWQTEVKDQLAILGLMRNITKEIDLPKTWEYR